MKKELNLAYKYRLNTDEESEKILNSFFTLQRRNWNCLLAKTNELFDLDKTSELKTSMPDKIKAGRKAYMDLRKAPGNEWMNEVLSNHRYTSYVEQALQAAWKRFFEELKKGTIQKKRDEYAAKCALTGKKFSKKHIDSIGKPKFKSIHDFQSYSLDSKGGLKGIDFEQGIITLQHGKNQSLPVSFRIRKDDKIYSEDLKKVGKITISRDGTNAYYLSVAIQVERDIKDTEGVSAVGIDMGCKTYAVLSDGKTYDMPDTSRIDVQIKNIQLQMSAKYEANKDNKEWSKKNWSKLKAKIAKLHKRKANIRSNATHNFTNEITKNYDLIAIEDLNVVGMMKKAKPKLGEDGKTFVRNNKKQKAGLSRSIADKNFFETGRQLVYKAAWNGKTLVKIDRFFASSKICNCCGHKFTGLTLAHREWTCEECGTIHDRDLNAAANIKDEALRML